VQESISLLPAASNVLPVANAALRVSPENAGMTVDFV
jgi:hypothetical protein